MNPKEYTVPSAPEGVTLTRDEERSIRRRTLDLAVLPYFLCSTLLTAGLLATLAYSTPPFGIVDDKSAQRHRLHLIQQFLRVPALREHDLSPTEREAEVQENHEGGTGTRGRNESGKLGRPQRAPLPQTRRYGRRQRQGERLGGQATALDEARQFGIIGLLHASLGDPWTPTAPWHGPAPTGNQHPDGRGNLWASDFGDALGLGGLGLTGVGEGGGGRGEGVGLGTIGSLGHGGGTGRGMGFGPHDGGIYFRMSTCGARGSGFRRDGRVVWKEWTQRDTGCAVSASGRLPPEVIRRVIQQNHGRFRFCLQEALTSNPGLAGRVSVRFVISRRGSVANAANAGSDLPDPEVVACVVRAFYGLSFPKPEGGIVTVEYPFVFSSA